jgi:hypothetical protein
MGGRGGVQGSGRLSGMALGVMRDNAGHRGYVSVFGYCLYDMVYDFVCYTSDSAQRGVTCRSGGGGGQIQNFYACILCLFPVHNHQGYP